MEQKQLDEMDESFFGEEFVEDDNLAANKNSKSNLKKEASNPSKKDLKSSKKKSENKMTAKKDDSNAKEEVEIKPLKENNEKKTETKTEAANNPTPVDPWGDNEDNSGLFKDASTWKVITGIAVILLVLSIFTQGFRFSDTTTPTGAAALSLSEAEGKALSYVNNNLLQPPFQAELESSEELDEVYKVTLNVAGQSIDSYITKDGQLFFPQGFDLANSTLEESDSTTEETGTTEVTETVEVSADDDAVQGNPNSPVVFVEFSDYQCPYCGKYIEETYPQIKEDFIDTGKIKYVFRDFPLNFHPNAQKAAEAAECAGEQGMYWEMHDLLFANQDNLDVDSLKGYAEDLGLDEDEFNDCLDNGEMEDEIKKDISDGQEYGISGTPGFFINGKLISGAQPYSVFKQEIEAALASVGETVDDKESVETTEVVNEKDDLETEQTTEKNTIEEETATGEIETANVTETEETTTDTNEDTEPTEATFKKTISAKKWIFTPNEVTVTKGDSVELTIVPTGLDFTFAIADLDVSEEVSGTTKVTFTADKAGSYEFECSSCEDWRGMKGTLIVK